MNSYLCTKHRPLAGGAFLFYNYIVIYLIAIYEWRDIHE